MTEVKEQYGIDRLRKLTPQEVNDLCLIMWLRNQDNAPYYGNKGYLVFASVEKVRNNLLEYVKLGVSSSLSHAALHLLKKHGWYDDREHRSRKVQVIE